MAQTANFVGGGQNCVLADLIEGKTGLAKLAASKTGALMLCAITNHDWQVAQAIYR